jgi:hypothetical protein
MVDIGGYKLKGNYMFKELEDIQKEVVELKEKFRKEITSLLLKRKNLIIALGKKQTEKNVHTEHCCVIHGCKYGDPNCPVEKGVLVQSIPCEYCESDLDIERGM